MTITSIRHEGMNYGVQNDVAQRLPDSAMVNPAANLAWVRDPCTVEFGIRDAVIDLLEDISWNGV